jgi:hypothetical protein
MRDVEHHRNSELRLLAAVGWSIREHGGEPSSRQVDELLDERLAHRGGRDPAVDGVTPVSRCHIPPKECASPTPLSQLSKGVVTE